MDFNSLIFQKLEPLFKRYDLLVFKKIENQFTFKSDRVVIKIVYNDLERSSSIYVAKDTSFLYPLDDRLIKTIFNYDIKIDHTSPESFINSLSAFFAADGRLILQGDEKILRSIEEYVYKVSENYTNEIVTKQNLAAADKAWKEADYQAFINCIDKTNKKQLPSAYELKYKMALSKLNKQ